jgi:transposase-like protein
MEKEEMAKGFAERLKIDYPFSFKRWIAREVESKRMTISEVKEKYQLTITDAAINNWVNRYGLGDLLSLPVMTAEEKQEKAVLERRVKELEKALELAKFKNIAIETMIDIAEEQLKISIRKKSGPKQ